MNIKRIYPKELCKKLYPKRYDIISLNKYRNEYLQETKRINIEIDKHNTIVREYNTGVLETIKKIKKIQNWDDAVEFKGVNYGIPCVLDMVHRENDCFGKLIFSETKSIGRKCIACSIRVFSNNCECSVFDYHIYECDRCNYKHTVL